MTDSTVAKMETVLKPCPFCGSTDLHIYNLDDGVRCNGCSAKIVGVPDWVERWNRRESRNSITIDRQEMLERLIGLDEHHTGLGIDVEQDVDCSDNYEEMQFYIRGIAELCGFDYLMDIFSESSKKLENNEYRSGQVDE